LSGTNGGADANNYKIEARVYPRISNTTLPVTTELAHRFP